MSSPRRNDFLIPTLGVIFDVVAIEGAFLVAYWLRFGTSILHFLPLNETTPPLDAYMYGSFVVVPIWLLLFNSRKMYGARRNVVLSDEFFSVVKLVTIGMLVVMSIAFFYRAFSYSRIVFGLLWIAAVGFVFVGRSLLIEVEKTLYRSGRDLRNAVIIGNNEIANRIFQSLHNHPLLGYKIIGYFGDRPCMESIPLTQAMYLGTIDDVPVKLVSCSVELALVSLGHDDHRKLSQLVQKCEGRNVEFMMVPDFVEMMASRMAVHEIEGIPFIRLKGVPMTTWGRIAKRALDVIGSSLLLIPLSPLFALIAVAIIVDSRGPIFYKQVRVGIDGRCFQMLKFRSMRVDAEQTSGPMWAKEHDPRRTAVGRFLRKMSLDEFPQLINVLKGEMSLVGPRPERPYFVEQFKSLVPKYLDRHRVKTGITGWAQVNGLRGNTSLDARIKYDIYYIENWSLAFDLKILLRTVGAIFHTKHVS